jgi:hypothetical protein
MGLRTMASHDTKMATEGRAVEKTDRRKTRSTVTVTMRMQKQSLMVVEAELYLETSARRVETPRQEVLQTLRFVFTSHGEAMDTTMKKVES